MSYLTKQEVFDKVVRHLRQQGRKSTDVHGNCRYRGSDGDSCAIGVLIPDEAYVPIIEGRWPLMAINPLAKPTRREAMAKALLAANVELNGEMLQFLKELQVVHDDYSARWENEWQRLAIKHGLTMPTEYQVREDEEPALQYVQVLA